MRSALVASLLLLSSASALAQNARSTAILPPLPPWSGKSRALAVPAGDPWVTPSEASGFRTTPSYEETVAWLRRLVAAAPQLRMVSLGKSPQGRDIWMVIASKERAFTPDALRRTGKPMLFAQGGIHSGEIDGKDAGLMLLRDMTVRGTRRELLDGANLLFVPIFSVDAHERTSPFNRVNQRGPENMGWRTNAQNLNLNRDYMKADTAEMQAMLRALDTWRPDVYADLHVTDGADYQYDITFGWNNEAGFSPTVNGWLEKTFRPAVTRGLADAGHIPGDLVFPIAGDDVSKGIGLGNSDPRFSNAYADARHMAGILVENHSLKPYDQRVLGTYIFLEQALRVLAREGAALRSAIAADIERARRAPSVPLSWRVPAAQNDTMEFLGIEARPLVSAVSGNVRWEWTGKPVTMRIPVRTTNEVATSVTRPRAYWVPVEWSVVIDKLALHGIQFERLAAPREVEVEVYRVEDPKLGETAFEGHVRVTARPVVERRRERFAAGEVRVPTDQPLGTLAVLLLEPSSPDSLFQWGFMHSILNPTEYIEPYILEPMAERMLAEDPKLAAEFREKLATDDAFRGSARARLQWFYRKTPFYDPRARLYPIGRE
jgi:murein tripeptide amidase MpaA